MTTDIEEQLRAAARDVEESLGVTASGPPDLEAARRDRSRNVAAAVGLVVVLVLGVGVLAFLWGAGTDDGVRVTTDDPSESLEAIVTFPDRSQVSVTFEGSLLDVSYLHSEVRIDLSASAPQYQPLQAWVHLATAQEWAQEHDVRLEPLRGSSQGAHVAMGAGLSAFLLIEGDGSLVVVALPAVAFSEIEGLTAQLAEALTSEEDAGYPTLEVESPFSAEVPRLVFSTPEDRELVLVKSRCAVDQEVADARHTGFLRRCYPEQEVEATLYEPTRSLDDLSVGAGPDE